ncbi:hypothetical protein DFJ77DRAFT_438981 [Powellomyces hirtus]|nr:hypothetical protein DFJ77DRAFT_438981 [Powellomyces hirtus]
MFDIQLLNEDVLHIVCSFLDIRTLLELSATSRQWRSRLGMAPASKASQVADKENVSTIHPQQFGGYLPRRILTAMFSPYSPPDSPPTLPFILSTLNSVLPYPLQQATSNDANGLMEAADAVKIVTRIFTTQKEILNHVLNLADEPTEPATWDPEASYLPEYDWHEPGTRTFALGTLRPNSEKAPRAILLPLDVIILTCCFKSAFEEVLHMLGDYLHLELDDFDFDHPKYCWDADKMLMLRGCTPIGWGYEVVRSNAQGGYWASVQGDVKVLVRIGSVGLDDTEQAIFMDCTPPTADALPGSSSPSESFGAIYGYGVGSGADVGLSIMFASLTDLIAAVCPARAESSMDDMFEWDPYLEKHNCFWYMKDGFYEREVFDEEMRQAFMGCVRDLHSVWKLPAGTYTCSPCDQQEADRDAVKKEKERKKEEDHAWMMPHIERFQSQLRR